MNIYPKFTPTHIKEVKLHVNAHMPVDSKKVFKRIIE